MSKEAHNKAITDLLPDTLIELYEVEAGPGMGIKRFHAGKIVDKNIIFDGLVTRVSQLRPMGLSPRGMVRYLAPVLW